MGKSKSREGYQVGVFKDGKMKHIMKIHEANHYLKEKTKKLKEKRPKRECSDKQLEALARGRAIREKNRKGGALSAPKVKTKNQHRTKENKVSSKGSANRSRVRKEKEMETGKHRKHESAYDSDHSDGVHGPSLSSSDEE